MSSLSEITSVETASFQVRNRGSWVTLEYDFFDDFCFGQTTGLGDGAGCAFQSPELRNNFFNYFPGISYHHPRQVHDTDIEKVNCSYSACYPCTDGLVSELTRTALTVLTADCLPVFVFERSSSPGTRFALLHAGRVGLSKNIIGQALAEYFRGPVHIVVGTYIHRESYPVNDQIISEFSQLLEWPIDEMRAEGIIKDSKLDLLGILRFQAEAAPVEIKTIQALDLNTAGNERIPLLSYRQDGTEERMLHWVYQKE